MVRRKRNKTVRISGWYCGVSLLLIAVVSWCFWTGQVAAATMPISEIPLGGVISVAGQKFVKVNLDSLFVAADYFYHPGFADGIAMQDFTSTMCKFAPTPSGTDYFLIGTLVDKRDNKPYEVRKFADGNCWMTTNLAYGGADKNNGVDGCLKTTFSETNSTPTDVFGPNTYGDCRYPYDDVTTPDTNHYGYLYNWQAAVQDANAYGGQDYQPTEPTQGVCPDGWYLPTGGTTGQFQALHTAAGSPTTNFWQPGGAWDGVFAGYSRYIGALGDQGSYGLYWSSTQNYAFSSYFLYFYAPDVNPAFNSNKSFGLSVRCLQDGH